LRKSRPGKQPDFRLPHLDLQAHCRARFSFLHFGRDFESQLSPVSFSSPAFFMPARFFCASGQPDPKGIRLARRMCGLRSEFMVRRMCGLQSEFMVRRMCGLQSEFMVPPGCAACRPDVRLAV
jgi:hypothetical protein